MTVLTDLDDAALTGIISAYQLDGLLSVVGIADGKNESTFLFRTPCREIIMTLFESEVSFLDLERAFLFMDMLNAQGFPCPQPIRSVNGDAAIRIGGKIAAAVSYLEGVTTSTVTAGRCLQLGRRAAQLHSLFPKRPPSDGSALVRGHIHGALTPGNVFYLGNNVTGIINFRQVHEAFLVSELTDMIANWTMARDGTLNLAFAQAIVTGYCQVRPLRKEEWRALPAFVFASATQIFAVAACPEFRNCAERAMNDAYHITPPAA